MIIVRKCDWGYYRICSKCKLLDDWKCHSGSDFWAEICPVCVEKQTV